MKIGCQVITWGMHPGVNYSTEQVLREVEECGYEGFEAVWDLFEPYFPEPSHLQDLLDSIGLSLASLYVGNRLWDPATRAAELNHIRKVSAFLEAMDCDCLICGSAGLPQDDEADVLDQFCQALNEAGTIAAHCGLKLCLHPNAGSMVERSDQLRRVMENTDPDKVFLAPDSAHIHKGGSDAVRAIQQYLARTAYIHLKDVTPDGRWCPLGTGSTNCPEIIRILDQAAYRGWIIAEEESEEILRFGPKECARRNYQYLKSLLRMK